jgi:excisionase family DNA binding protein
VPDPKRQPVLNQASDEILTLAEAAAFLRVREEELLGLIAKKGLPGQQIGGEWRFLKRALIEWLRFGPHFYHEFRRFPPPWIFDHPFWEDFFSALEARIVDRVLESKRPSGDRGSKQAVLKHFGVFQEDADLDEQLAGARARRKAAGG